MFTIRRLAAIAAVAALTAVPALAQQTAAPPATAPQTAAPPAAAPQAAAAPAAPAAANAASAFLRVYFDPGSAALRDQDTATLDKASRTFRDGQPIVMILTGSTDATGSPLLNLNLSQQRAQAVLRALVARGIPAGKFQLLAKGQTDPVVPDAPGQPQPDDRSVEIAWR